MEILFNIVLAACIAMIFVSMWVLHRNNEVYRFRREVADQVSEAAKNDIEEIGADADWQKRYEILDKVSYDQMLYSLKQLRIESFWSEEEICRMLHTKHPDGACF